MGRDHPLQGSFRSLRARRSQLLRYAGVSLITTVTGLTVLGVLVGIADVGVVAANLIATAAGTVPSFELNRRWVWSRTGKRSLGREVVPFCALSFAGLAVSTLFVRTASALASHGGQLVHTGAVELANLCAYGSLWVVQFVLLDRVLFSRRSHRRLVLPEVVTGAPWCRRLLPIALRRPSGEDEPVCPAEMMGTRAIRLPR